ncbi:MAG: COG3650 family protein [Hyphomonadaceae bacterium]
MRTLLVALALVACTPGEPDTQDAATLTAEASSVEQALASMPAWSAARAAGVDFRAVGQEPGWMLDIYREDTIRLLWDYGEKVATFPLAAPTFPAEGATRYQSQADGRTLAITIRRAPCQDVMSGEAYPSTVEVVIDGRTLTGCGRSL